LTFTAEQSRVDALIRLLGFVVLLFGAAWLYLTAYSSQGVASQIITVNYALGLLLVIVGFLASFAKFK
jgi:hypothetical protein